VQIVSRIARVSYKNRQGYFLPKPFLELLLTTIQRTTAVKERSNPKLATLRESRDSNIVVSLQRDTSSSQFWASLFGVDLTLFGNKDFNSKMRS
jgi:hypothetical protein